VGFGLACRLAHERRAVDRGRELALRERLAAAVRGEAGVLLNGDGPETAGHILSVSVAGVEGESLFAALEPLAVASGSACASPTGEPSYVLRLLGRSAAEAQASVRFSVGRGTTTAEVDAAAAVFCAAVRRLRAASPATGEPDPGGPGRLARGQAGSAEAGTWVVVGVRIQAGRLGRAAFRVFGCPDVRATCAALADKLAGQAPAALATADPVAVASALGVPRQKASRLLIVQDALRNCLADWENGGLRSASRGS
jgi:hypothetical protein